MQFMFGLYYSTSHFIRRLNATTKNRKKELLSDFYYDVVDALTNRQKLFEEN